MNRKICFVAPNVYPLLGNSEKEFIGGAELQQSLIGAFIHNKGYDVSYITKKENRVTPDKGSFKGMCIYTTYSDDEGVPFVRFIYPRLFRLWKALKISDSDIFYKRGPRYAGIIALFCLLNHKKLIFAGANNWNFLKEFSFDKKKWNKIIDLFDRWGIKKSDYILVQSRIQKELLNKNFGRDGFIVNNIYFEKELTRNGNFILWVANIKPQKRPFKFLEMVQSLPDLRFKMIGGAVGGQERFYEEVKRKAESLPNLDFMGYQTFKATEKVFEETSILVNTSPQDAEGFPNTFLQAWSRGIPVISFFDIDGIIESNRLGITISDNQDGVNALKNLISIEQEERIKIRNYFNSNHLPDIYLECLNYILKGFTEYPLRQGAGDGVKT